MLFNGSFISDCPIRQKIPAGAFTVRNPANHSEIVGCHVHHDKAQMLLIIDNAEIAFTS